MKQLTVLILFIFDSVLISCNPSCEKKGGHSEYIIKNLSFIPIEFKIMNHFNDTIIPIQYNAKEDRESKILPNSSYVSKVKLRNGDCIEDLYANDQKYWIYFFNSDTLDILDWETIRLTNRGVLERRIIDLEYLQSNNFTITYPE